MYNIGITEIIITDRLEDDKGLSIKYSALNYPPELYQV